MKQPSLIPPTYDDIAAAARRLDGAAHRTPVLTSRQADAIAGAHLFFKAENFQRIGAFKFRGAFNAIAQLDASQRRAGVLAYSSGNHAQAIALAASLEGIPATIVMPEDAPTSKMEATRGYCAEIVTYDRYREDRMAVADKLAHERGLTLIPPYDHPDVIAGQGTAAKELFEEIGELDTLLVCLGGGGLTAGCALAAQALSPHCRVIAVEPEAGNDGQRSLSEGRIVHIEAPRTLADGAATTHLGDYTFPIIQRLVSEIVTVSDQALVETMRFFASRMKITVEPTGCLAAAAVLQGVVPVKGQRVGILISGGNVDMPRFAALLAGNSVEL
ncbi:threo-3-hydroxy-L-aspartate ammonia-lyase [Phytohalomonas tamaricis]|uniref:threo-3-hydroxy-L-aspartate ammonia-lyase n=1 Tax=Phytohalomonas tamaricis TaxID=2081032 RepID=UPI000D0BE2E8|nr:threo-3-hydroxy-L-aspartate ammonia-lyase [Phytohalomonas tamaricis]